MKIIVSLVLFFLVLVKGISQDVYSVESQTKGLSLGGYFGKLAWTSEDLNAQSENGFYYGFHSAYGFNHQWSLHVQTQFASIKSPFEGYSNYPYFELEIGGRYFFMPNTQKWRPFLGVHVNYSKHREDYPSALDPNENVNLRMIAIGVGLSGGIHYFVNSHVSIFGFGQATFGGSTSAYFDGVISTENYGFSAFKFGVGLAYHFKD
ncbi:MAG: outer membrane beta-barrel protein [Saprospiraceae bacterium]